jgi:ferrochelatase
MSSPIGVLVMAHGTPGSAAEIGAFYTRIRHGRPPSAEQLADLQRRYEAIGGLSPLTERTTAQVGALRDALETLAPGRYVVIYGAKHTEPLIEAAALELIEAGADPIVGLVLTPHGSSMGSEEYITRARSVVGEREFVAVPPWYDNPAFVDLLSLRVTNALATLAGIEPSRCPVIFTAHSLPERVRESGDTYPEQLERSAQLVAKAAGIPRSLVAWQSAGRTPEPWLGPDVRDVIRQLGHEGEADAVVVCPIGFVSDHLEILYDLDIETAAVAKSCGLGWARTESLNDDHRFISALADVVEMASASHRTS